MGGVPPEKKRNLKLSVTLIILYYLHYSCHCFITTVFPVTINNAICFFFDCIGF